MGGCRPCGYKLSCRLLLPHFPQQNSTTHSISIDLSSLHLSNIKQIQVKTATMKSFLAFLILSLPFLAFASPTVSARDACRTIPVSEVRQVYEQHPETTGDQQMVAPNVPGCWGVFQTQVNESTISKSTKASF